MKNENFNNLKLFSLGFLVILLFASVFSGANRVKGEVSQNSSQLAEANDALQNAFVAVLEAEQAGADISGLLGQLNDGANTLAHATVDYRVGNVNLATEKAEDILAIAAQVKNEANGLGERASANNLITIFSTWTMEIAAGFVFVSVMLLIWILFRRARKHKIVFFGICLIGGLLIASPAISGVLSFPSDEQVRSISELYLLGAGHLPKEYPYNVEVGQNYTVYVGVGNHLGSSAYYTVYVKLQNQTDRLPNATTGTSSPLQPLYEYTFAVQDGEKWESPLTVSIADAHIVGSRAVVDQLIVNNVRFDVNELAVRDSNSTTFCYQLVFELWLYDVSSNSFQFNKRFVSLQLNLANPIVL